MSMDPKIVAALNALADVLETHRASIDLGYDGDLWLRVPGAVTSFGMVDLPPDSTPSALRERAKEPF